MKKTKEITICSLFLSIHVIILFLSNYLVGIELFVIFLLPLFSAYLANKVSNQSQWLFILATFSVCFLLNPISSILYILPSLLSGYFYGKLHKVHFSKFSKVFFITYLNLLLLFFSISIINLFYSLNFYEVLKLFFKLKESQIEVLYPSFLLLIAFAQTTILSIIIEEELIKLLSKQNESKKAYSFYLFLTFLFFILSFIISNKGFISLLSLSAIFSSIPLLSLGYSKYLHRKNLYLHFSIILLIITLPLINLLSEDYLLFCLFTFSLPLFINGIVHLKEGKK